MTASDIDLVSLLVTRPTFTIEEAARLLASRQNPGCTGQRQPAFAVRPQSRGAIIRVLERHATAHDHWSI
jgi:hypothetical protein